MYDLVVDGEMGALHAIVPIESFLDFRRRSAEREDCQNVMGDVVMETS